MQGFGRIDAALEAHEERIKALETILPVAVLDLLYNDQHSWSTRGCSTCQFITTATGVKFGCVRYADEKSKLAKK